MDIPTLHGLLEAMPATFRKPSPLGHMAYTLFGIITKTLENL
jgi:hypothetical protein